MLRLRCWLVGWMDGWLDDAWCGLLCRSLPLTLFCCHSSLFSLSFSCRSRQTLLVAPDSIQSNPTQSKISQSN
ncbi:hypothetical protein BC567DRAFT_226211 [Phyllosticta citribraziliensis]